MRFRARLMGVEGLDKPKEQLSNHVDTMRPWIEGVLESHPTGWVEIVEYVPTVIARIVDNGKKLAS